MQRIGRMLEISMMSSLILVYGLFHLLSCSSTTVQNPAPTDPPELPLTNQVLRWPIFNANGSKIIGVGIHPTTYAHEFYEVDTAGGIARQLTSNGKDKAHPILSPDGTRILYLSADATRLFTSAHVWVMNIDGSEARDLTSGLGYCDQHTWSPDGAKIAFVSLVMVTNQIWKQIASVDADGSNPRFLTMGEHGNDSPRYTMDGNGIFYSSSRTNLGFGSEVYFMSSNGSGQVPLDSNHTASHHAFPSPVQPEVLFAWDYQGGSFGLYRLNFGKVALPTDYRHLVYTIQAHFRLIKWSPDGEWFGITRQAGEGNADLFVISRDGRESKQITTGFEITDFSWSRNSHKIVMHGYSGRPISPATYIVDLNRNTITKLPIAIPD